jgi:hypothetical protein
MDPAISFEAPLEFSGQSKLVDGVKALSDTAVIYTAMSLKLPVKGIPSAAVRTRVMYELQHMWFEQMPGGVPPSVEYNYIEACRRYQDAVGGSQ